MKTKCLAAFAMMFLSVAGLFAQQDTGDMGKKLQENPNDVALIRAYVNAKFREIAPLMRTEPAKAEKILDELAATLAALSPDNEQAKVLLGQARTFVGGAKQQVQVGKTPMEDIVKRLEADPADTKALEMYGMKLGEILGEFIGSEPDKSEAELKKAKEFLERLREKAKDNEEVAKLIDKVEGNFAPMERMIENAKRLVALIGQDAAPLQAEAWVNGEPLTDAGVKGKVVLLDFWAVWCGPCIATFPHLREWNEEYADKGLVMIGVTKYYNFSWDAEAGKAARSKEEVSPEDEQSMLVKFAEQNNLHHRFAVEKDGAMSEFYAVTGIPQVVVIDRAGKIRLIKVGSGPDNAKEIGELLKTLIEE